MGASFSAPVQTRPETHAVSYRGTDKSLARPRRKQTRKHVRDARDFNNIETRAVIRFFLLQGKAPKEIHAILTETLACFLPGRAKYLSAPLYYIIHFNNDETRAVIKFFPLQGKATKEIHAILTEILTCFLPDRAKNFSAPLFTMGTGSFPGLKRPGLGVDHQPTSSAEVKERIELNLYISLNLRGLLQSDLYLYIYLLSRSLL